MEVALGEFLKVFSPSAAIEWRRSGFKTADS